MTEMTHLTDFLRRNAKLYADKPAVITDDRQLSWSELGQEVDRLSRRLRTQLPQPEQQLVALIMPNGWQYVVAHMAILQAGHIVVPIDVIYKTLEIDAILSQLKPALVITDDDNRGRVSSQITLTDLGELASLPESVLEPLRLPAEEQIATIFFTSGTTGKPKAVPNTHANHIWNIKVCSQVWDWTPADSLLISVRLHHMLGSVMGLSGVLYHGNTFYLTDRFEAKEVLSLLQDKKISMFSHAPLVFAKLAETEGPYDLSGVRLFISGSGPLSPATWQAFKDRYGHEILEVYGSSETGRIASNLLNERQPGSPGRPLPEVQLRIEDNGELAVKSPGVFPGYYQNKELTNQSRTTDGYWRTGDIAAIEDGRIILKGRTQELIRRMGYTVSPRDIEWAVHTQPDVQEIAVLARRSRQEEDDELIFFVVTKLSDSEINDFCKQQLPSIWRPDKIMHLEELPRNERGKIDMQKLKSLL